ncbi:UNVERIFIED_CONTAM: hypothetical protein Sindi_0074900, partial [Sesamum indicum]
VQGDSNPTSAVGSRIGVDLVLELDLFHYQYGKVLNKLEEARYLITGAGSRVMIKSESKDIFDEDYETKEDNNYD